MSRRPSRSKPRNDDFPDYPEHQEVRQEKIKAKVYTPLNQSQKDYLNKINNNILTFGIGPAGTGKSFIAALAAAEALTNETVKKLVITRPVVEAGEQLGFLPGELNDKFGPYVAPILDCLRQVMGGSKVDAFIQNGKITFLPLAYMRGHSFNETFVIADEMQNATKTQMKLFLTRIGRNSKVVVDGDLSQKDIEAYGLDDATKRLQGIGGVAIQTFVDDDIVRSGIVRDIIRAYSNNKELTFVVSNEVPLVGFGEDTPEFLKKNE